MRLRIRVIFLNYDIHKEMTTESMRHQIINIAFVTAALLLPTASSIAAETTSATASVAADPAKAADKVVKKSASKASAPAKVKTVDINSADRAELKTLPGVGDAEAEKIVNGRPFGSKSQLTTRGILPRDVYETIKQRVIAKQDKNTVAKLIQK